METAQTTEYEANNNGRSSSIEMRAENPSGIAGAINLSDDVVATIAGLAAQDIDGIAALGKSRWVPFGDTPTRGVDVEVGSMEAAVDVDVVIEYGCDLEQVGKTLRERMAKEIKLMANREVVEVNINVVDVKLPEPAEPKKPKAEPRVR